MFPRKYVYVCVCALIHGFLCFITIKALWGFFHIVTGNLGELKSVIQARVNHIWLQKKNYLLFPVR